MKDKEVHNSHKRKEEVSAKGVLFSSLSSLALTAVCIVFEVLCLKYFKEGFIAKNLASASRRRVDRRLLSAGDFLCGKGKKLDIQSAFQRLSASVVFFGLAVYPSKDGISRNFSKPRPL